MAHYDDIYDESNKVRIEEEIKVKSCKERMINEIPMEDMIKIMFTDYLNGLSNYKVLLLADAYL